MRDKKILVTGAGGFIPSHVVEALVNEGARVVALVHYNGRGDIGNLRFLGKDLLASVELVFGDVRDAFMVRTLAEGCDAIVHMAALIGIPYSYVAPASYIETNVSGTLNILEAARHHGTPHVIVTSTSEVYGTALYEPIDEAHPLQAQSPYSASKISADMLTDAYFRSFDLPVTVLRPFNTYGPRQSTRAVIPTIISQALQGASAIKLGSLSPKRDMIFVKDTARAFLLALQQGPAILSGQTVHFGTGQTRTIGEIAQLALQITHSKAEIVLDEKRVRPEKSEVGVLVCNPARARELLMWEPSIDLSSGLEQVARFVSDNPGLFSAQNYRI